MSSVALVAALLLESKPCGLAGRQRRLKLQEAMADIMAGNPLGPSAPGH